jgi:hypothetical protein
VRAPLPHDEKASRSDGRKRDEEEDALQVELPQPAMPRLYVPFLRAF